MNYRHAFHAGNFADVVKHAAFARILVHLRAKEAAFRILDVHAGAGLYDLAGEEANRTGEWRNGIGRLRDVPLPPAMAEMLAPYLDAVAACNWGGVLARYPGSPLLALRLMRPQDRLTACELAPAAAKSLAQAARGDPRASLVATDGWAALKACLPPRERRGVVLIDPPFEEADELSRLAQSVVSAWRKWPTGIYLLWRPIKDRPASAAFARTLADSGVRKMLQAELHVGGSGPGLRAAAIVIVNPPWRLADELKALLGGLTPLLAQGPGARCRVEWLRGES